MPKQIVDFRQLEEAVPEPYRNTLRDIVREERDRRLGSKRVAGHVVDSTEAEVKRFLVENVNLWLSGVDTFSEHTVLTHRPFFVSAWAIAKVLPAYWWT